jgi:hypothetical protein
MPVNVERCFSCSAPVPRIEGPTHAYLLSSPGCWKLFGELLDTLRGEDAIGSSLQDAVDAYAVQHPGTPGRREAQSVHVHLASLHLGLERGLDASARRAAMQVLLRGRPAFTWLEPPSFARSLTIADAVACRSPAARREAVAAWAASAWEAWKPHRTAVVGIVARILR